MFKGVEEEGGGRERGEERESLSQEEYIHTHIVCFEGEKYVLRGKKRPKFFRRPRPGNPGPLPSIRSRDDIIHLKTPYTWACRGAPPAP